MNRSPVLLTSAVAAWMAAAAVCAQTLTSVPLTQFPSEPGQAVAIVMADTEGRWVGLADGFQPVPLKRLPLTVGTAVIIEGKPGDIVGVLFIPASDSSDIATARVVLGGASPTPEPPPVVVVPEPEPDQPDPTTPSGQRWVISIREQADTINETKLLQAVTSQAIRNPDTAPKFASATSEGRRSNGSVSESLATYAKAVPPEAVLPYVFAVVTPAGQQSVIRRGGEYRGDAQQVLGWFEADAPSKVDRVTYVFEQRDNSVPRPVAFALQKLNGQGIIATEFDDDTTDGDSDVPDQYKIALAAARDAGIPCLVVQAGDTVVRVVRDPKTEQDVLEAVR